jgi:hypothetical protein
MNNASIEAASFSVAEEIRSSGSCTPSACECIEACRSQQEAFLIPGIIFPIDAYETLVKRSKQFDPKYLMCHTTRFEQPERFSMKLQQMELANVQCESCHGFAKERLSDMKTIRNADSKIGLCLKCHTADRCTNYEKDEKIVMEKIQHKNQ